MVSPVLPLVLCALLAATPPASAGSWSWSWSSSNWGSGNRKALTPVPKPLALPSPPTPTVNTATSNGGSSEPLQRQATPATVAAPATGYGDYLGPHNTARSKYGAGALTKDSQLEAAAQALVNKCVFAHSGGKYGENLYMASGQVPSWQNAVDAWMSESSKYNAANPDYTQSGHFTQVVWKSTVRVGCAAKNCSGKHIMACEYDPPGNYQGRYAQNVG